MSKKIKWTSDKIQEDALNYQLKTDWARTSQSAYQAARRLNAKYPGFLEDVTAHMKNIKRGRKKGQLGPKNDKK